MLRTFHPKSKGGTLCKKFWEKNGFYFLRSQTIRKTSLIPMVYDIWVKCLGKWAKKCKICLFWPNWAILPQNGIFYIFWPTFSNIWPKCHTPLESVKFFWLFETLKSKIHFFHQKFYKGSPLWILGEMSATMKASGVTSHYFREKISSQFILVLWMTRKTKEPKIFENFSIFHSTLMFHMQFLKPFSILEIFFKNIIFWPS